MAPEVDTFEGWTIASALAARTSTIRIGHLVLCDPFRHPVLLAKMAAKLRRDLGRSARARRRLGVGPRRAAHVRLRTRTAGTSRAKLRETLEILELMFAGEPFDYDGRALHVAGARPSGAEAGARSGAHRWWRPAAHDAARRPTRIGGTAPATRSTGSTSCGRSRATRGSRRSIRSASLRTCGARRRGRDGAQAVRFVGGRACGHRRRGRGGLARRSRAGVEGFVCQFSDFGTPETIDTLHARRGSGGRETVTP